MYQLRENKYLPNGLGKPAKTYYYFVNGSEKVIDFKTLKPYRGKQMNRYAMHDKIQAQAYLDVINKTY